MSNEDVEAEVAEYIRKQKSGEKPCMCEGQEGDFTMNPYSPGSKYHVEYEKQMRGKADDGYSYGAEG